MEENPLSNTRERVAKSRNCVLFEALKRVEANQENDKSHILVLFARSLYATWKLSKWSENDFKMTLPSLSLLQEESRPDYRFRLPLTINARATQLRLVCFACMSGFRLPSLHPKRCRRALPRLLALYHTTG
jgi:hypothetical protein